MTVLTHFDRSLKTHSWKHRWLITTLWTQCSTTFTTMVLQKHVCVTGHVTANHVISRWHTCLTPIALLFHMPRTFQKNGVLHFSQRSDPAHSAVYKETMSDKWGYSAHHCLLQWIYSNTVYSIQYTVHTITSCNEYTIQYTVYTNGVHCIQCIVYTVHTIAHCNEYTVYSIQCIQCTPLQWVYSIQYTVYTIAPCNERQRCIHVHVHTPWQSANLISLLVQVPHT